MAVEGDLTSATQLEVKKHGSLLLVPDIQFANFKLDGRSALYHAALYHALTQCSNISHYIIVQCYINILRFVTGQY